MATFDATMPANRITLDFRPDPEVTIIGISSHVKNYRLCWSLNRALGLTLQRHGTDITEVVKGRTVNHAFFVQHEPECDACYLLVENYKEDNFLVKEHRQADYFLVLDEALSARRPELLDEVRAAEFVLTAYPIPYHTLKTGYKLLPPTE